MDLVHAKCAGLDVHKDTVVAAIRLAGAKDKGVEREVRTFGTMTKSLLELADWLTEHEVTHVAMEATGVYWKPVWHVLESMFELVLANAAHIKNVPGRKTDVNDATWIAELLAHGLIRGSFVPEGRIQDLRALTRTRKQLVREKAQHVQRIQKTLEDANIKFSSVVADIMGTGGRAVLQGIVDGETDPEQLVHRIKTRLRADRATLVESLRGTVTRTHRFLLKLHLDQIDGFDTAIAKLEAEVDSLLEPFREAVQRLITIPGVSDLVAQVIVSEVGVDMARFPTVGHLISWAGMCSRNDESAGKRRSSRLRKGAPWLKTTLVQAAWCATRAKDTYLRSQFLRLRGRRGSRKAIMAVAASMLTSAYFMLKRDEDYQDLGAQHFDEIDRTRTIGRLVRRLQTLGCHVDIKQAKAEDAEAETTAA